MVTGKAIGMKKRGSMKTPANKSDDFLIPLYRGRRIDVYTTCRGELSESENPYDGFSLCHYTDDSVEHVESCKTQLSKCLDVPVDRIVVPRQVHGIDCRYVDGIGSDGLMPEGVDAVVTDIPGLAVGVNTADCLPVVLVDEDHGVVGVVHAGWRGALAGVVHSAVGEMCRRGASTGEMEVFMGPCICVDCFEVGEEVSSRFPVKNVIFKEKPHVDLAGYVHDMLIGEGVADERIHLPKECTKCNPWKYFSARASGIKSGRNFTFAVIRD